MTVIFERRFVGFLLPAEARDMQRGGRDEVVDTLRAFQPPFFNIHGILGQTIFVGFGEVADGNL